jgi:hypothetical protein
MKRWYSRKKRFDSTKAKHLHPLLDGSLILNPPHPPFPLIRVYRALSPAPGGEREHLTNEPQLLYDCLLPRIQTSLTALLKDRSRAFALSKRLSQAAEEKDEARFKSVVGEELGLAYLKTLLAIWKNVLSEYALEPYQSKYAQYFFAGFSVNRGSREVPVARTPILASETPPLSYRTEERQLTSKNGLVGYFKLWSSSDNSAITEPPKTVELDGCRTLDVWMHTNFDTKETQYWI